MIYLSPGNNGNGEIQYDPVMNGSTTWQIYYGPSYLSYTPYKVGDWVKFTIDVNRHTAKVYIVDDTTTPQLNEEEIYQGVWMWDPPKHDGRIRPDHISIPVTWRSGINTIRAEITSKETVFGWGVCLKTGIHPLRSNG